MKKIGAASHFILLVPTRRTLTLSLTLTYSLAHFKGLAFVKLDLVIEESHTHSFLSFGIFCKAVNFHTKIQKDLLTLRHQISSLLSTTYFSCIQPHNT